MVKKSRYASVALGATLILLSSCTSTKIIDRQKSDITTETTKVIDTTVTVQIKPIIVEAKASELTTIRISDTIKTLVDTITTGKDTLFVQRKGNKLTFTVKQKPVDVVVHQKVITKERKKTEAYRKESKKPVYLWYVLAGMAILLLVFCIQKKLF